MSLPPDADRRRTAPSYYILTYLGQRDEPPRAEPFQVEFWNGGVDTWRNGRGGNPEFTWLYLAIRSRQRSTVQRISRLRCGTIIEVTEMPSEPDADCFSPKIAAIRATFSTSPMRCCLSPIVIVLPQQPRSPSTGIPVLTAIGND
jgi:hypothetical protein